MSPTVSAALLLALLAGAPPPTPATPPVAATEPGGCTGTLSGAVTATFSCTVTARVEGQVATVTVAVDGPVAGVRTLLPGTVSLATPVGSGAYTGEALASASARVETAAGATFQAGKGRGEVTLTVDQAESYRQAPHHLVMSGSLKARLLPAQGGKGEVVVEVRF